jgi:CheY-like chemotaxis protein
VVRAGPGAADDLLREAQLDARSGVLSAAGEDGVARVVLQAGEVVQRTGALPGDGAAEFQELDARREQILTHEARAAAAAASAPLPEFDDLPAALRTVLVAEDDDLFRDFLSRLLTERGFTVYPARDGEEALRLVLEHRPWLILTDVSMPGVDGIELCRRVRRHSLVRHTPLVFVSGWDDYKDRYRGLSAGADEFVSKATPVRELLIRVQLVLRRYVELGRRGEEGRGLAGDLGVVGAPGLLQMCHLGRLSGTLDVRAPAGRFEAHFRAGELLGARCGERHGAEAVFDFLAWSDGRFAFAPGQPAGGATLGATLEQILLEGCRRLDESRRATPD